MASTIKSNTIDTVDNTALTIKQNDTTAITVDTSQNVGIGTTSPNSPQATNLHISGTSSAIRMSDTFNSMTANLYASGGEFEILTSTSHPIVFKTANSERMRLSSDGLHLGGTGSANALDDYEEGTWTPIFKGDGGNPTCTYDIQSGQYIKIGRQVTAWFQLGTDASSGGSGSLRVGGIPFTPDPSGDYGGILTAEYGFATTTTIARLGNGNSNGVRVDDDEGTAATVSILGTGTNDNRLFGTIVYYTA